MIVTKKSDWSAKEKSIQQQLFIINFQIDPTSVSIWKFHFPNCVKSVNDFKRHTTYTKINRKNSNIVYVGFVLELIRSIDTHFHFQTCVCEVQFFWQREGANSISVKGLFTFLLCFFTQFFLVIKKNKEKKSIVTKKR